jgi:hypothetical protein
MRRFYTTLPVLVTLLLASPFAAAHKPVVVGADQPSSLADPYVLDDVTVSQVGYHAVSATAPAIWFRFAGTAGQEVLIQGGVPKIERFRGLRPLVALVGPGLPAAELPFALPEGFGALVFDTANETPEEFDEPFTGTQSWQFAANRPILPQTGDYYAVGYLPPGETGKIWLTVGTIESFGLGDILTLPAVLIQVRLFHEVFPLGGLIFWALLGLLALALLGVVRWA